MEALVLNHNSKSQIIEFVERNKLVSVMNNTKWSQLFRALEDKDEMISFKVTYIDGSTFPEPDASFQYTSELAQVCGNFLALEYIDINAKISHSRGALLEPEIADHTDEIIQICNRNLAKFSHIEDGIRVYGYLRHNQKVQLKNYT